MSSEQSYPIHFADIVEKVEKTFHVAQTPSKNKSIQGKRLAFLNEDKKYKICRERWAALRKHINMGFSASEKTQYRLASNAMTSFADLKNSNLDNLRDHFPEMLEAINQAIEISLHIVDAATKKRTSVVPAVLPARQFIAEKKSLVADEMPDSGRELLTPNHFAPNDCLPEIRSPDDNFFHRYARLGRLLRVGGVKLKKSNVALDRMLRDAVKKALYVAEDYLKELPLPLSDAQDFLQQATDARAQILLDAKYPQRYPYDHSEDACDLLADICERLVAGTPPSAHLKADLGIALPFVPKAKPAAKVISILQTRSPR